MSDGTGTFEPAEAFDRSIATGAILPDPPPAGPRGAFGRLIDAASDIRWHRIGAVLGLCLFAVAAIVVYREAEGVTWDRLQDAIAGVSEAHLAGAILATAFSYLVLIGYDVLALRQVGAQVPLATAATASFIGQAFTFTIGFGLLTGNAVRLRIYTAAGVSALEIVAIGFLCAITFWLGLAALAGLALISEPSVISLVDDAPVVLNRAIGVLILAGLAGYVAWVAIRRKRMRVGQWGFTLPGPRASLAAIGLGALDTAAAALALWLLLPVTGDVSFPAFLTIFIVATALGVVSHVPGGVGVFESTFLLALPQLHTADLVAALVLFRIVYYLIPFGLALLLLAFRELVEHQRPITLVARRIGGSVRSLFPQASALAVFGGGAVLLLSGATPSEMERLQLVRHFIPLPFVESSHLLGSVVGVLLLVVATGLVRRLATAWQWAIVLLAAGALFSLVKGADYEEALVCVAGLGFLLVGRHEFYRRADFFGERPSPEWIIAILIAVAASIWLGFFAYRYVDYSPDLWWHFAYRADAPRFLRASLVAAVTAIGVIAYALIHRPPVVEEPAAGSGLARAQPVIASSSRVVSHLGLIGDKNFLFAEGDRGAILYGRQHGSLVAMGDPIAPDEDIAEELVWRFKELADKLGATPVFYQVSTDYLPIYLDAGLSLVKLGEEAWVDLSRFTLEGGEGRRLRQAKTRAEKAGASFAIVPAGEVAPILEELRDISRAWLGRKGREKGFSLGFWTDEYMLGSDQAIIRQGNRIVAFANIWRSAGHHEFTIDLMRQRPDMPGGAMDLLFICLLEQARREGFGWFSMGMAPLSGLPRHRLASRWSRLGALIYRRGDRFYNFEGLRAYKEKFKPEWRPRYLAYPGGLVLPKLLLDVTTLIANSPARAVRTTRSPAHAP
jgi:phosphatidylglycerol lysyltransferase